MMNMSRTLDTLNENILEVQMSRLPEGPVFDEIIWLDNGNTIFDTARLETQNISSACCEDLKQNVETTFQNVPNFLYIIYSSYISLVFVLGLGQNAVSLYVFLRERGIRKVHNVFIFGLALGDVLMCLLSTWMVIISSAHHRWIFGHTGCVYYGFTTTLLGITQISLLATIALDRYLVIVRPTHSTMSMKKAVVMVICCYSYGFLWALFPAVGWSSYQLEGIQLRCAINWRSKGPVDLSYSISILVLAWVVPLGMILYCYGAICSLIWNEKERPHRSMMARGKSVKRRRREQRVAVTVLLMIGAFFLSWTPYSIVTLIVMIGELEDVPLSVIMIPTLMVKTSIIWNPMIYVARHNDFRKACLRRVPCISWIRNAFTPSHSATNTTSYSV